MKLLEVLCNKDIHIYFIQILLNVIEFEFIGVLRHMQRYFSHVTAQMCRRTEEVVPTVGLPTP